MTYLRLLTIVLVSLDSSAAFARQPIFFTLYGGGEVHDADYQTDLDLALDLDDDGDTFGLGVGYEVTDKWIVQLDYTYTDAGDTEVDQFLLSLNYKFPFWLKGMHGLAGLVVGQGTLELEDETDFTDRLKDDTEADQTAYGLQLGLSYDLTESWSTRLMYQYFDQEFSTHLQTDTARVNFTHENFQYVLFGVSYHF
jgi:opacity protein-like surface antigen